MSRRFQSDQAAHDDSHWPMAFLIDTGADPASYATPDFDKALARVEKKCRDKSACVWQRKTEGGVKHYAIAAVWQDNEWKFFKLENGNGHQDQSGTV